MPRRMELVDAIARSTCSICCVFTFALGKKTIGKISKYKKLGNISRTLKIIIP